MSRVLRKPKQKHLPEGDIDDYLGGYSPKRVKKHLRRCNLCCGRMLQMRSVKNIMERRERGNVIRAVRTHRRNALPADMVAAKRPRILSAPEWDQVKETWFTPTCSALLLIGLCIVLSRPDPDDKVIAIQWLTFTAVIVLGVAIIKTLDDSTADP